MKKTYIKTVLISLIFASINIQGFAQKDTTEFEIGKKKLIIVENKTQKENAIYNLEKGKESFITEIQLAEDIIKNQQELIRQQQKLISDREKLITEQENLKNNSDELEKAKGELEKQKLELGKQKSELEKQKSILEINTKKKFAFENGIKEIEKGIEEIKKGLDEIDSEMAEIDSENGKIVVGNNIKKKKFNAHWAGLEIALLNFLNNSQTIISREDAVFMEIVPEKTFSYGLNVFEKNIPISKYHFGIATGTGIQWSSLNLEQDIYLYEGENNIIAAEVINTDNIKVKKNKLNVAYIKVPLILEYQVPVKGKKLYFNAGIFGSIRGWSKQRLVYFIDGRKYKDKIVDNFQLSAFRYGFSAGAGYGDVGVFVEYSMTPLFNSGKGPEMYPVMVGLRFIDF
ncbi:MAG: outer membrane beta-barrel protein [Bacteroidales bacterium]|nr:outer membrane beta-barrel protein [Bacteroidales bacterium]